MCQVISVSLDPDISKKLDKSVKAFHTNRSKLKNADIILTGDKDLLDLQKYLTTEILPPRDFKRRFMG